MNLGKKEGIVVVGENQKREIMPLTLELIGAAGMVIAVMVCAVPVIRLVLLAFIYKFVAAMVQPVSDKRITACIGGVSEGYGLLLQILLYTALFFLITLAVIAGATS